MSPVARAMGHHATLSGTESQYEYNPYDLQAVKGVFERRTRI